MRRLPILLLVLAAACNRDGAAPFSLPRPSDDSASSGRLTYNVNGDHTPAWNTSADSVYYTAWSFPSLPPTKGMLLGIPRSGGIVKPLLPALQVGTARTPWFSAPAISQDGNSIAFFEMTDVRDHEYDRIDCPVPPLTPQKDTLGTSSFLQEAVLRVRKTNSTSSSDDARLTVKFAGRTDIGAGTFQNTAYPFHRLFDAEGVPFFRASWSPDGTRLVFSDGTQLRLWTIGSATSTILPGTDDGILPAWSPDGSWIAFSKPFKGATQTTVCFGWYNNAIKPAATFQRTIYTPLTRENAQLFVVHPDGTGLRNLGVGDGPAWTSDSKTIVAHRDFNLFRIDATTGTGTVIGATLDGFEPAVSRDGKYLTFARRKEVGPGAGEPNSKGQYNIWVVAF